MTDLAVDHARMAFDVFAHRAGDNRPWEHLTNAEQAAWEEAIAFVEAAIEEKHDLGPCCPVCDAVMTCPKCDKDDDEKEEEAG